MTRDPRYDILFEPVRIGPVQAPNRFYQVPHCNGMGFLRPRMVAAMRGIKAAGDCDAPALIAAAIYAGHRYARELGTDREQSDVVRQDKLFDPD